MSINKERQSNTILEICVDSLESAMIAEKAGAQRLELCSNLIIGGTSPSPALAEYVKKQTAIPVYALIRPRFGDFCYSSWELAVMIKEIDQLCALGIDGIVIGCLKPDGNLDIDAMRQLIAAAGLPSGRISITLHRAFDMCKNPLETLVQAEDLGINTILTSGQKESCFEGRGLLTSLAARSLKKGGPAIMAGGGLKPEFIVPLAKESGIRNFHMSAKKVMHGSMQYKNLDVTMSFRGISEYEQWITDASLVQDAKAELDKLFWL